MPRKPYDSDVWAPPSPRPGAGATKTSASAAAAAAPPSKFLQHFQNRAVVVGRDGANAQLTKARPQVTRAKQAVVAPRPKTEPKPTMGILSPAELLRQQQHKQQRQGTTALRQESAPRLAPISPLGAEETEIAVSDTKVDAWFSPSRSPSPSPLAGQHHTVRTDAQPSQPQQTKVIVSVDPASLIATAAPVFRPTGLLEALPPLDDFSSEDMDEADGLVVVEALEQGAAAGTGAKRQRQQQTAPGQPPRLQEARKQPQPQRTCARPAPAEAKATVPPLGRLGPTNTIPEAASTTAVTPPPPAAAESRRAVNYTPATVEEYRALMEGYAAQRPARSLGPADTDERREARERKAKAQAYAQALAQRSRRRETGGGDEPVTDGRAADGTKGDRNRSSGGRTDVGASPSFPAPPPLPPEQVLARERRQRALSYGRAIEQKQLEAFQEAKTAERAARDRVVGDTAEERDAYRAMEGELMMGNGASLRTAVSEARQRRGSRIRDRNGGAAATVVAVKDSAAAARALHLADLEAQHERNKAAVDTIRKQWIIHS